MTFPNFCVDIKSITDGCLPERLVYEWPHTGKKRGARVGELDPITDIRLGRVAPVDPASGLSRCMELCRFALIYLIILVSYCRTYLGEADLAGASTTQT